MPLRVVDGGPSLFAGWLRGPRTSPRGVHAYPASQPSGLRCLPHGPDRRGSLTKPSGRVRWRTVEERPFGSKVRLPDGDRLLRCVRLESRHPRTPPCQGGRGRFARCSGRATVVRIHRLGRSERALSQTRSPLIYLYPSQAPAERRRGTATDLKQGVTVRP